MTPTIESPGSRSRLSAADPRAILKARAEMYAQLPTGTGKDSPALEVVRFAIGREHYALQLHHIQEVLPLPELTPLPGTPSFILGIINVRGHIISVIDLKTFFDLPQQGLTNRNHVIILHSAEMEFGLLADEILGVSRIAEDALQATLPTLTGVRQEYLRGVSNESVAILDAMKLLTDPKMVVNH